MVYYDTHSRLQFAREHADRLADEMRRSRRLTPDEAGYRRLARLGSGLAGHFQRLLMQKGRHTPAYDA